MQCCTSVVLENIMPLRGFADFKGNSKRFGRIPTIQSIKSQPYVKIIIITSIRLKGLTDTKLQLRNRSDREIVAGQGSGGQTR